VLFLDIDHFEAYDDACGHQEGDCAFREVALAIVAALREEDVVSRYGGEESTNILGCDSGHARHFHAGADRNVDLKETRCQTSSTHR